MGKDKKKAKETASQNMLDVGTTAKNQYDTVMSGPSQVESEMTPISQNYADLFNLSAGRQMQDYGDMMTGYQDFSKSLKPTTFGYNKVSAKRPEELGEAYGYLREAAPGYREFASTGGYSPTDIQELRARGVAPIRSAYGNTMMEMNRSRSLGGAGGSPNYIAAASKAQRDLPGQMADATTTVNAGLAEQIRNGKLAGLSGLTGIGDSMGGLSSAEASRILQADTANQSADLQAKSMTEQSLQNMRQGQLSSLSGQSNLYGTSPAMAATFGNQALNAYQTRAQMEQNRQQTGLQLLGTQMQSSGNYTQANPAGTPWWQTAMQVGGTVAPYVAQYASRGKSQPMMATDMSGYAV